MNGNVNFTWCISEINQVTISARTLQKHQWWLRTEKKICLEPISIHHPFPWKLWFPFEREVETSLWGKTSTTSSPSTDEKVLSCFIFSPFSSNLLCCKDGGSDLFLHTVHWFLCLIMQVFPLPFDTKLNFNSREGRSTAERMFCWTLNEIFWELITLQVSCSHSSLNPVPLPGLLFPAKGSSLSPSGCYLS